ncbi:TonB-dependent receptor [uncultured Bacteroides sp.]|uniref:TonB-dependent receptor n=1 Tax=uncultured Bacteroides sp. TaxID=162156 RepID=UPI00262AB3A0|nr:TonB-dependent receptor [uncultured Bacteroides sp.]
MNRKNVNAAMRTAKRFWMTLLVLGFIAIGFVQAAELAFAQATVTARFRNVTLDEVLWEMQKQTNLTFIYSTEEAKQVRIKDMDVNNEKVSVVLDRCLRNSGLMYTVHNGAVVIKPNHDTAGQAAATQQKVELKGVVTDAELNEPVIGANVVVMGTGKGTVTDLDGRFVLQVDKLPVTLSVSFVGYQREEVKVSTGQMLKIVLKPDYNLTDEVVVTGYGTFKKSAYAGSASTLKTDNIKDVPTVSFMDMLQGNAPGVQFSSPSGQPGAAASINIRGMGSFNASNSPLYVIDGVPVISGSINSISSDAGLDIMSTINSSDIENITIIKDAAAASLYGSRAANGVVLITTKTGKVGKPVISFKADWGMSDFAMDYRPVMNGAQRREYIYNGLKAGALRDGDTEEEAIAYADAEIDDYAPIPWCGYVNWDDVMFKKGSHQTYEASISGGTDKFKYYSSLSYLKQEGIAINSGLERISGRLNADYQATDRLKLGANILFATVNQDVYGEGTSYTSPFYSSRNAVVPSDAVYNEDGSWNRDFIRNSDRNPLLAATYDYQREYVNRAFNTVYGEYEFLKDLKFKTTLSYDYTNTKGKEWSDPRTSNGDDINGGMDKKFYEYKKMVWTNQLSYKTTLAKDHHIDVLAGYEIDDQYRDYLSGYATNFATADKNDISNGMKTESVGGSSTRTRMVSYLTRLNYDYKHKYYLGGSYRMDGSSRFHRDNRWGSFWSVSAAWRIIEEEFMKSQNNWLTDLKLRASYGVNGTLPSDYYGYMGLSSLTNGYLEQPGIIQSQIKNEDLQWETNYNLNLGIDFALFNRVNVTLEYYTRTTKNLLMDRPISMTTGFSSYLMNIGEVKNRGVELEISSTNIRTKDFSWNTVFNLSHNRNEIVKLDGMQTEIISGNQIRKVGKSYRTFYMIEFAGINPETGAPQFYTNDIDENGNYIKEITEKSSEAHAIVLDKHAEPNVVGGLTNTLRYKWFDLNFMFSYQFGGYSYDTWAQKTEHGGNDLEANIPIYYLDNWKKPGDVACYEVFIEDPDEAMNKITTTRRLHSTDFIRLKTLTFGVTLPKAWTQKAGLDNVRLYASANNLWTWAAYDYYDPEAVSAGTAIWGTPPLKTITFGLNVNF